jgi:hypothetical protein
MLVKTVIAGGAVETFDEGILHGFAGLDVVIQTLAAESRSAGRFR